MTKPWLDCSLATNERKGIGSCNPCAFLGLWQLVICSDLKLHMCITIHTKVKFSGKKAPVSPVIFINFISHFRYYVIFADTWQWFWLILWNCAVFGLFYVQHSLMATDWWKNLLYNCYLEVLQRTIYIAATALCLQVNLSHVRPHTQLSDPVDKFQVVVLKT